MSSPAAVSVASYPWPADVLAFAVRENVSQYLEPLLAATRTLFPTADVKVSIERDVSLPEEYIVFEIRVPRAGLSDYLAADRRLRQETHAVVPTRLSGHFILSLERVP
jgi:hypothetical protein